jgi:hypothetical protein
VKRNSSRDRFETINRSLLEFQSECPIPGDRNRKQTNVLKGNKKTKRVPMSEGKDDNEKACEKGEGREGAVAAGEGENTLGWAWKG